MYFKQSAELEKAIDERNTQIANLEHTKKVLQQTNSDLNARNIELESEITVATEDLDSIRKSIFDAERRISELNAELEALQTKLAEINELIESKTAQLLALNEDYNAQTEQYTKDLSMLSLKKTDLENEIIQNRAQDDKVRENLADWERKLNEKDANLRVREARANEQEKSIARNYNLLNI